MAAISLAELRKQSLIKVARSPARALQSPPPELVRDEESGQTAPNKPGTATGDRYNRRPNARGKATGDKYNRRPNAAGKAVGDKYNQRPNKAASVREVGDNTRSNPPGKAPSEVGGKPTTTQAPSMRVASGTDPETLRVAQEAQIQPEVKPPVPFQVGWPWLYAKSGAMNKLSRGR